MTKRSILVAAAFAMLVAAVSSSSSFARNSAAGAPGAAGSSSGGGSGAGSGGGGTGGSGNRVSDGVLNPGPPPRLHKPVPVAAQTLKDARCALGPTEIGYFGPERVMLTQICANQL